MEALGSILKDSFNQQAFSCVGDQMLEQFAREAADSPSYQMLKTQLDKVLSTCSRWPFFEQGGWTRWSPEVPSNFNHLVILWECLLLICIPDLCGKTWATFLQRLTLMSFKHVEDAVRTWTASWSGVLRLSLMEIYHLRVLALPVSDLGEIP